MLDVRKHAPEPTGAVQPPSPSPSPESPGLQVRTVPDSTHADSLSPLLQAVIGRRALDRSALASAPGVGAGVARGAVRQPTIQRNGESAALLTTLATPRIFQVRDVGTQTSIVDELERTLAAQKEGVPAHNARMGPSRLSEHKRDRSESTILFLGGIEITTLPESDEDLIREATLIDLPDNNALGRLANAFDVVQDAGVADDLVENTLETMGAAGQLDYLRSSGLVNPSWKIIIEIHYYRDRPKTSWQLHKDTLGQTLFVNLNYHTAESIAGPEYLLNPPLVAAHETLLAGSGSTEGTLPQTFREDLAATRRSLGAPGDEIKATTVPAYGVVAFVDEAMHHMTPRIGHRTVTGREFGEFLNTNYRAEYADASNAYKKFKASWVGWPFRSYLKTIKIGDSLKWLDWMEMVADSDTVYTRAGVVGEYPELEEIWAGFQTVSIPKAGAKTSVHEGRPPLKRQMSALALTGDLPPDVEGKRTFFRTWVRAVRR